MANIESLPLTSDAPGIKYFGICWCCEKSQATRINCIPMGAKWGLVPVELCSACDDEIG